MADCEAKIRPLPNPTEIGCEKDDGHQGSHSGVLRDYAYPGSETVVDWQPDDRRSFAGDWSPCRDDTFCVLPGGHHGRHAD